MGQELANATPDDLAAVEVTPSGIGLHWETLDVDLTVPSLLRGIYGTKTCGWNNSNSNKLLPSPVSFKARINDRNKSINPNLNKQAG